MLRPSPYHGTLRLPNYDDDDDERLVFHLHDATPILIAYLHRKVNNHFEMYDSFFHS